MYIDFSTAQPISKGDSSNANSNLVIIIVVVVLVLGAAAVFLTKKN